MISGESQSSVVGRSKKLGSNISTNGSSNNKVGAFASKLRKTGKLAFFISRPHPEGDAHSSKGSWPLKIPSQVLKGAYLLVDSRSNQLDYHYYLPDW